MLGQFGDVDGSARGPGMQRWGNPSAKVCQKTVKLSTWEKQFSREQQQPSEGLKGIRSLNLNMESMNDLPKALTLTWVLQQQH